MIGFRKEDDKVSEKPFGHYIKQWDQNYCRINELFLETGLDFM